MKRSFQLLSLCLCWLLIPGINSNGQDEGPISTKDFERLMQEVNTPADKPWRQIPWKISLLEAQKEAAESGKPIFIWAMDGHPLGCT